MKDVSVSVKQSGAGCTFWLFPTTEALLTWIEDSKANVASLDLLYTQGHVRRFDFTPGESFRIRWCGCEIAYFDNGQRTSCYNLVCLHTVQKTAGDPIHRLFKGYISKEILPLEEFDNENVHVTESLEIDEIEALDAATTEETESVPLE